MVARVEPQAITDLTRILELSITPVALISGVGVLLLSMTNRIGRVIDRARELGGEVESATATGRPAPSQAREELAILFRRARLLQMAIGLMATNVFMAVLMVVALFAMNLTTAHATTIVIALFGGCLTCLVLSIACFLGDIFLGLRWLRVSLGRYL
jgi:Protein of unknown function (DUF2721)